MAAHADRTTSATKPAFVLSPCSRLRRIAAALLCHRPPVAIARHSTAQRRHRLKHGPKQSREGLGVRPERLAAAWKDRLTIVGKDAQSASAPVRYSHRLPIDSQHNRAASSQHTYCHVRRMHSTYGYCTRLVCALCRVSCEDRMLSFGRSPDTSARNFKRLAEWGCCRRRRRWAAS